MQKTFVKNLVLIVALNVLIKPFWVLGVEVGVQNALGPDVYGNYFALLNFAFLFVVVLDFGLNNFTNRKISREPHLMAKELVSISALKLALSVGFSLILLAAGKFILLLSKGEMEVLFGVSVMFILQYFYLFLRANLSGIQWYKADVLVSVLDKSLMILIVGAMLWSTVLTTDFSVLHFIIGQCLAYALSILVVIVLLAVKSKHINISIDLSLIKNTLRESWPYALLVFLLLVYFKIDAVMIKQLLNDGDYQAGIYAQAYRLLEAAIMFAVLFSTLLLPMFSNLIGQEKKPEALVKTSTRLMMVPSVLLIIISMFYSQELMHLLFEEGTENSAVVFPVLMAVLLPLGASYIFGTLITAEGNLKLLNRISVVAIIVNVLCNFFLIQEMGIVGAAIATLIVQTMVGVIQVWICFKRFSFSVSFPSILRGLGYVLLILGMCILAKSLEFNWIFEVFVISIAGISAAIALKVIKLSQLREILSSSHLE